VPGEFLVKFKAGAPRAAVTRAFGKASLVSSHEFRSVPGLHLVRTGKGAAASAKIGEMLAADPQVEYIEPNFIQHVAVAPNDPDYPRLWAMHNTGQTGDNGPFNPDIEAERAWDLTTGSDDIVVAVIDSGVDYSHEDLAANIWQNPQDCDADGIDDDADGYTDDCHGIDAVNHDVDPMDDNGHGTHVAGTIGAVGNNGIGVAGVAWHVKILPCKFTNANGDGATSAAIECLDYLGRLKQSGVNLIASNNSWGSYYYSRALEDAMRAQRDLGVLFVAAAGNDGRDDPMYPCAQEVANVICVAASYDSIESFSNFGRGTVLLGAPGDAIYSTLPGNTYGLESGTSMAAPHVTGALVLLKAQDPSRDAYALRNLLAAGAVRPHEASIPTITGGRLDLFNSLTCTGVTVLARTRPLIVEALNRAPGDAVVFRALHVRCAGPAGDVTVSVAPSGETVTLRDDGLAPDETAHDGVYAGTWIAHGQGEVSFSFPAPMTDTVIVNVDPALKPGFPLQTDSWLPGASFAGPAKLVVGNIAGDPRLEILATPREFGPLWAWDAQGSVVPGWPRHVPMSGGLALGNFDADPSDLEPVVSDFTGIAFLYQGDATPIPGWPQFACVLGIETGVTDVDGDGIDELISFPARRPDGSPLRTDVQVPATASCEEAVSYAARMGDLDADGRVDFVNIVGHDFGDDLWISDIDGLRPGFPRELPGKFTRTYSGRALIGDVDGDGTPNVVIASRANDGGTFHDQVHVFDGRGKLLRTLNVSQAGDDGLALADIDGDGIPEIVKVAGTGLYIWHGDGSLLPGWPRDLGGQSSEEPAIGDIDGDGAVDIVTYGYEGQVNVPGPLRLHALHGDGSYLPGFPRTLSGGGDSMAPAAIADIDLDGRNDLIVSLGRGGGVHETIFAYDLHGAGTYGPVEWSQSSGDARHRGYYETGKNLPNHAYLATQVFGAGRITAGGGGIDCRGDCIEKYGKGTNVVLTATASAGGTFARWRGACAAQGNPCTLPMQKFTETSADFDSRIAVALTGDGSVSSVAGGIQCPGQCEHVFPARSMVTLTAVGTATTGFADWSGACAGSGAVCTLFVDDAKDVGATFTSQYPLTISKSGAGRAVVTSSAGGIDCGTNCSADLPVRSSVRLTVVPSADSYLVSWHRPECPDTLTTCDVVMNGPVALNVEIALKPVVAVTVVGSGRVVVHPVDVECRASCNVPVDIGPVGIDAFADSGWHFVRWENLCAGATASGACNPGVTANAAITAVFARDPTLTVTRGGNGSGSVSSDLGGISCPSDCSASFNPGRTITLTAAASSDSRFTGWGGACSGMGSCAVTIGEDATVVATFTRNQGGSSSGGGGGGRIDWLMLAALALLSAERLVRRARRLREPGGYNPAPCQLTRSRSSRQRAVLRRRLHAEEITGFCGIRSGRLDES